MSVFKNKFNNKDNIQSDQPNTKQNNLKLTRKYVGPVLKKVW